MATRFVAAFGLVLGLAAGSGLARPGGGAAELPASRLAPHPVTVYICVDGPAFAISFAAPAAATAWLSFGAAPLLLQQAISASGARYTGAGYEFWGKGLSATLTGPDGRRIECQVARPPR